MKEPTIENNASELKNPLPDKIPNIVWDDLLHSSKMTILGAIEKNYIINYFHTERKPKEIEKNCSEHLLKDRIDHPLDTDVIEIEEVCSEDVQKYGYPGMFDICSIYSRATSERGVIRLDNPIPDIIPCDIWNNLPDVLKETIINTKNQAEYNEKSVFYFSYKISYCPHENTIIIYWHHHFDSFTHTYDAKRGILIDEMDIWGL
jgi:hypothetical protein